MAMTLIKVFIERSQKYKVGVQKTILHNYFVRISPAQKASENDSVINMIARMF